MGEMSVGLSVTNDHLVIHAYCILVLNMKFRRVFNPFNKPIPAPLPFPVLNFRRQKYSHRAQHIWPTLPKHRGDTSEISVQVFLPPLGTMYHISHSDGFVNLQPDGIPTAYYMKYKLP